METYVTPEMKIIPLDWIDILTTSGNSTFSYEYDTDDTLVTNDYDSSEDGNSMPFSALFGQQQK
jgi:hypothetical protein